MAFFNWFNRALFRLILWLRYSLWINSLTVAAQNNHAAMLKLKAARAWKSAQICRGAEPCAVCGNPPIGLIQPRPGGQDIFEIGCSVCLNRKAKSVDRKTAVLCWNAGLFKR
jgi:hypothetical protein